MSRTEDWIEIHQVLTRYCTCVDQKDVDRLVTEVFAEDARDNHGLGVWENRAGLHEAFTDLLDRFAGSVHVVGSVQIELVGDVATTSCYVTGWHWLPADEPATPNGRPADFTVVGAYHDRLERRPAGWRIVERTFRPVGPSVNGVNRLPDFMIPSPTH
ncbi:MAG: nuclear transport factor 2 family protein, partial [Hyphomicrobiales bacterium]